MKAEIFKIAKQYIPSEPAINLTDELCNLIYGSTFPHHKVIEIPHTYRKRMTPDGWELCFWDRENKKWNDKWELFPAIADISL